MAPGSIKVVIMGRDPYPDKAQATGRSFEQGDLVDWSNAFRTPKLLSKSLRHLAIAATAFKHGDAGPVSVDQRDRLRDALRDGNSGLVPPNQCFDEWAKQGVLWLNRAATYSCQSEQAAHLALWKPFTDRVLEIVAAESRIRKVVVALWGDKAQELENGRWRKRAGNGLLVVPEPHPSAGGVAFLASGNPLARINEKLEVDDRITWNTAC